MGKSAKPQTVRQELDPATQRHVNQLRAMGTDAGQAALNHPGQFMLGSDAAGSIQDHMSPFMQGVVDPVRAEFDRLRGQASLDTRQQATSAGAFGGSRAAVMEGSRLGQLDHGQAQTIGQLHQQGFGQALAAREHERQLMERQAQEPLFRHQNALGFMNLGMGPVGSHVMQDQRHSPLGSAAGGAMAGSAFGPWGAAIGGVLGGLGGLFG
jgi:hypothetical protein